MASSLSLFDLVPGKVLLDRYELGSTDSVPEGVAFDREEHEAGIISIAAPILTNGGRVIGALSIATSTTRHSLDSIRAFEPDLLETARKIGEEATAWQFPTVN